jgi:hypothetical protein
MVALTCLLPTGMLVKVNAASTQTFTEIKDSVWKFARELPFFRELKVVSSSCAYLSQTDQPVFLSNRIAMGFKVSTKKASSLSSLMMKRMLLPSSSARC